MRLSAVAVIAASAALLSAAPVPVRLLIISSSVQETSPITGVRFGHAVPPLPVPEAEKHSDEVTFHEGPIPVPAVKGVPPVPPRRFRHHPGCRGMKAKAARFMRKFKLKALEISNAFRKAFGLPLIEIKYHHLPHSHETASDRIEAERLKIMQDLGVAPIPSHHDSHDHKEHKDPNGHHHGPHRHHHHHHHHHHHRHDKSFLSRLHFSLMNLGRWEGRAVAFVIGCGIGVLLRMFWVLAVVSVRTVRGPRSGYAPVSTSVMEECDSDDETAKKEELPKYVYSVVEKIAVEESK